MFCERLNGKCRFEYNKKFIVTLLLSASLVISTAIGQNTAIVPVSSLENRAGPAGWTKGSSWIDQHNDINIIGQTRPVDLVFLGDSITQSFGGDGRNTWQPGRAVWDMYYSHRNAGNFGISGDRTQHILWRIDHGNFDIISPKVIVLMIGTNNMANNTAEEIAHGVKTIVRKLRAKSPKSKILLLSTFPGGQVPDHEYCIKTNALNAIICHLRDGKDVYYLDIPTEPQTKNSWQTTLSTSDPTATRHGLLLSKIHSHNCLMKLPKSWLRLKSKSCSPFRFRPGLIRKF